MFDELIERCIENDGYIGLIVVKYGKDKKYFIDKFKELNCIFLKQKWKFKFNNKSYICILSEIELEARRGHRNNYVIMDDRINWKYRNNFVYPSLIPYRNEDGNIFYESVVEII